MRIIRQTKEEPTKVFKALALLSGGLDSTLAIKLMLKQEIDVTALNFTSPFCTCTPKKNGCVHQASLAAKELGIKIKVFNKGEEYLEIIKNPRFGYGKNINPCIDCRIFILKKAKEYMKEIGAHFIVSGEVLGQRPMSQRKDTLNIIERESGLKDLILRPLSAELLKPTIPEKEGWVDRNKLLSISGRSRKIQLSLADSLLLKGYACPAGGCLLTDPEFARKMKDLIEFYPGFILNDCHLLKVGRHFRLSSEAKLIVARNEDENKKLLALAKNEDLIFEVLDFPGPIALLRGKVGFEDIKRSASIDLSYSKGKREERAQVSYYKLPETRKEFLSVPQIEVEQMEDLRI
jgi:tRNA U34 2-thiouridine synthase MnmA/TrmU